MTFVFDANYCVSIKLIISLKNSNIVCFNGNNQFKKCGNIAN